MALRILTACLFVAGSANAQLQSDGSASPPASLIHGHSGPNEEEKPQYSFEIRAVSVSEASISPLRSDSLRLPKQIDSSAPFDGWKPVEPNQSVVMHKAETRIQQSFDAAVVELSDEQIHQIVLKSQADDGSRILAAPKVTVFRDQAATISDGVTLRYVDANPSVSGSTVLTEAYEGTKIMVRPTSREDGRTQADVEFQVHSLPDRGNIPVGNDGTLLSVPQKSVSTVSYSALMSREVLHTAILPPEITSDIPKPAAQMTLASRVVGFGKTKVTAPRQILWLVSVRKIAGYPP